MSNITEGSGTWRRVCGNGGDDSREDFVEKGTCKSRKEEASRARWVRMRWQGHVQAVVWHVPRPSGIH